MPNLDLVARRCNLETDAQCAFASWWLLLTVDKEFLPRWRQSKFPGGCAHACELETSVYMHLAPQDVRMDKIRSGKISFNEEKSPYRYVDLFGAGPVHITSWTSSYSETGVLGEAELATPEKGPAGVRGGRHPALRVHQRLGTHTRSFPQGKSSPRNDDSDALGPGAFDQAIVTQPPAPNTPRSV